MIRYPITQQELETLIDKENATWRTRAKAKTDGFRAKGVYKESSSIWSEIKSVYMRIQHQKCAFCERQMESEQYGKIEQDVEHFRPKGSVKAWKGALKFDGNNVAFTTVPPKGSGYYLLPYHLLNYAASCKPCNSTLKSDCFPIAGTYMLDADNPAKLKGEGAYLLYPIGDIDDDPEKVITFSGVSPQPVHRTGKKRLRALVTIEFFKLDDPIERKNLYRERAIVIMALYPLLLDTKRGTAAEQAKALEVVRDLLTPCLSHLNCARSFERLFKTRPAEAKSVFDAAVKLITTIS